MSSAVVEARRVLQRGGLLIDLHPVDEPISLEVWHALYQGKLPEAPENLEAVHRAPVGWFDQEAEALAEFMATTDALAEAVDIGRGFNLVRSTTFDYRYFFDTLDELTDYFEDHWERAAAGGQLLERAAQAMRQARTTPKLVVVQRTLATALLKL